MKDKQLNFRIDEDAKAMLKAIVVFRMNERHRKVSEAEILIDLIKTEYNNIFTPKKKSIDEVRNEAYEKLLKQGIPAAMIPRHQDYLTAVREAEKDLEGELIQS